MILVRLSTAVKSKIIQYRQTIILLINPKDHNINIFFPEAKTYKLLSMLIQIIVITKAVYLL